MILFLFSRLSQGMHDPTSLLSNEARSPGAGDEGTVANVPSHHDFASDGHQQRPDIRQHI
jgi:hypothetical protein